MALLYKIKRLLSRRPTSVYKSNINKNAKIGNGTQFYMSSIGKYSYVYESKVIYSIIGKYCSIGSGCIIGGASHPIEWISSSPIFYNKNNVFRMSFCERSFEEYSQTIIGNDVWIGSNCLLKAGITVGDGAVIGMGSVVTHNVPPYEIWAGNPAKFIRKRFSDEEIDKLLRLRWWDLDEKKIKEFAHFFSDKETFFEEIEKII